MTYFSAPGIPHDPNEIISKLFKKIEKELGVTRAQLVSSSRKRTLVIPRQIFCHILYRTGKFSLGAIGQLLGNRDHTTVIHSVKSVTELLEIKDAQVTEIYNKIKSENGHNE